MHTQSQHLPVFQPQIGPDERAAVMAALDVGYLGLGPATGRFERELGSWLGLQDRHVTATSSCTAALHLAALLAGAGPGTEVVCPSFTYVAAHQAVSMTGADVVFADVDDATLAVDPARVRELVTDRTVAVMTMHYAGHVGDVAGVYEVAAEHGLRVIEDAAHALGSLLPDGRKVGAAGDLVAFSFGPVKTLTTIEGGALLTGDAAEDVVNRERRMLGADQDLEARSRNERFWEYDVVRQGYRYHLGTVPATVGLAQLAQLDAFVDNRRAYCAEYDARLADVPEVRTLGWDWSRTGPFVYVVRVDPDSRLDLLRSLRARGVGANVHWGQGAHEFTQYAGARRGDLPVTEQLTSEVVTLPLWSVMPQEARDRVVDGVRDFYGR
ncbi:MAG: hypothetical protein JWO60_3243 [Frankiales bacterium]|nr:hypothetical protein [Frankiales bacterium]